jgi:hypothetical protein
MELQRRLLITPIGMYQYRERLRDLQLKVA